MKIKFQGGKVGKVGYSRPAVSRKSSDDAPSVTTNHKENRPLGCSSALRGYRQTRGIFSGMGQWLSNENNTSSLTAGTHLILSYLTGGPDGLAKLLVVLGGKPVTNSFISHSCRIPNHTKITSV